jgi:hypothetical protein
MPGNDLQAEALTIALRHAPPEIGVAVWVQLVIAPPPPGVKGQPGPVPVWHLLLTMSNPANLAGSKLRHYVTIGNGAPDLARIPGEVETGCEQLRTLARKRLAEMQ